MADEEVVIRVVMEDAATGGGAGGTGGGGTPGSLTPRQLAKQAADIQVTLARGAAQAAVQMGLAQGKAQAQLYAANAKAQAQAQGAFGKMYAQVSKDAANAAKAHANAAAAQAKAAAAPALLAAKVAQEQAKAAAMPGLLQAQTQLTYARAQAATARSQIVQAKAAQAQKSWFDTILDVMDKLRGTLGGLFGTLVGGTLDFISGQRRAQAGGRQPAISMAAVRHATRDLLPGEAVPEAPPGTTWKQEPVNAPGQPFQPGVLTPKKIYSVPPTAGTAPKPAVYGFGVNKPAVPGTPGSPGVLAPGQPGTSLLSGMSGGGAAGGAVAIITMLYKATVALKDSMVGAAEKAGQFATTMVSASTAPAKFISDTSGMIKSIGDSMGLLGGFISIGGALGQGLGSVMGELTGMGQRYGAVNPQIAMANAIAEVNQTLGDFRRGQEAAPDLVNFINQQSQLQQKFEEVKIRALQKIMPAVIGGMEIFEKKVLPLLETIFEGLAIIARAIGAGSSEVRRGIGELELAGLRAPEAINLPTNVIRDRNFRDVFTQRGREGAG